MIENTKWMELSGEEECLIEGGGIVDAIEGWMTNKVVWTPAKITLNNLSNIRTENGYYNWWTGKETYIA